MNSVELQMIYETQDVADRFQAVALGVVRFSALAVPRKIHRNDTVRFAQCIEEPAGNPRRTDAEDEAVQQDDWLALSSSEVVDVDAVGIEVSRLVCHHSRPSSTA